MKYCKLTSFLLLGFSLPAMALAQPMPNSGAPSPFMRPPLQPNTLQAPPAQSKNKLAEQSEAKQKQSPHAMTGEGGFNQIQNPNGTMPIGAMYGANYAPVNPENVGSTNKVPAISVNNAEPTMPNWQPGQETGQKYRTGIENLSKTPITVAQNMTSNVTLSASVASVYVADPNIITVHPASNHRLVIFGVKTGQTAITAVDSNGNPIAHFVVTVVPSGYAAQQAEKSMPDGAIATEIPGAIKLTGTVETPLDAVEADRTAKAATVGTNDTVLNGLNVSQPQQVMLQVKIAQMSRSVTQQLGINWQSIGGIGEAGLLMGTTTGASAARSAVQLGANALGFNSSGNLIGSGSAGNYTLQFGHTSINAVLSMLDADSLAHILAEPTLMALSGHTASFQSGGSFPVPIPGQNGQDSIEFQNYGVQLQFRPIVLSSGQIYLDVEPTVSQVSNQNSVTIGAGSSAMVVPSLVQQTAKTTVMLGSGQTLAIAGLLEDQTNQSDTGVPGLSNIPIFGAAFKSDFYQRTEQELVILVTPYLVTPQSNPNTLHVAGQNWTPPNLIQRYLLGRQVGTPQKMVTLPKNVGFLLK